MEENMEIHTGPREVKFFIDKHVNEELEDLGITAAYGPFIMTIKDNPDISLKDISYKMSVDKAFTTRMTKNLIDEGFAVNKSDDSRKYKMELTDKGQESAVAIKKAVDNAWDLLLKDFSPEEKEAFMNSVKKIKKTMDETSKEEEE